MRILFVNRMAAMERGGGETFDLEMARHLSDLGCKVTFLAGIPLFGKARLGPKEWWGREERLQTVDQRPQAAMSAVGHAKAGGYRLEVLDKEGMVAISQGSALGESDIVSRSEAVNDKGSSVHGLRSVVFLRTPYFGWFPWDKVRGGWRLRVADFMMFEWAAARWAWKHRDQFDVIQVCELPFFVHYFKKRFKGSGVTHRTSPNDPITPLTNHPTPIVLRLTAPNAYDPVGGIKLADAVIASGTSIEKVRKHLRPDCHDVPNGVDVEKFQVSDFRFQERECLFRSHYGIPSTALVLLYVARFQAFKNHDMLLRAFSAVLRNRPETWLVLVGSGPLQSQIKRQAESLGVDSRIVFLGEVAFADLPEVYQAADMKVISSDYESFCFAAIEAMACGLPVVTTDCGWVPKLLGNETVLGDHPRSPISLVHRPLGNDKNRQPSICSVQQNAKHQERSLKSARALPGGIMVPVGNAEAFADSIALLASDPGVRQAMGQWNRERVVSDFTWNASAQKLLSVYKSTRKSSLKL